MNSLSTRANAILYFGCMVLFTALMANVATSYFFSYDVPNVSISLNKLENYRKEYKRGTESDMATVYFDINADFTPVFNWNTKMIFVYVTAEYETQKHKKNSVVIWDHIMQRKDPKIITMKSLKNKYPLIDQGTGLGNNNITLTLNYNLVPITGLLHWTTPYAHKFTFPKNYHK